VRFSASINADVHENRLEDYAATFTFAIADVPTGLTRLTGLEDPGNPVNPVNPVKTKTVSAKIVSSVEAVATLDTSLFAFGTNDVACTLSLGGKALGFAGAVQSSAAKGESVADTIRVVSCFADIAAIRHNKEGAAYVASQFSDIPVINAGDGGHEHPTQTLLDMMTIRQLKGRLNHFTIRICGDLKFGRTVHSLVKTMARYDDIHFVFISPPELRVPDYITELLEEKGYTYEECIKLEDVITKLDLLYMTRVQRERFFNEEDYIRLKDFYVLNQKLMRRAKDDMYVLHPLPRVNEISVEIDKDPRAAYFKQVQYGVYVRMALILTLLDIHVD
jgi:aspartate carbamoyltransferase catalytic subunit